MPTLSRIAVHPIKALDPIEPERVEITDVGGLAGDRVYAVVDADGGYVNGKRTAAVHRLRADVDLEEVVVVLDGSGAGPPERFHLEHDRDRDRLEAWLSDYFGIDVAVEAGPGGSRTDSAVYGDGTETGPTLISRATLREIASWYPGIDATEMRLRLRPNLVVEGVPAFWEDRLPGERFRVGDAVLEGVDPVPRCVVPTRDPHTGEPTDGFRETFERRREETLPEWAEPERFDHYFKAMVLARVPESERGATLRIGDEVRLEPVATDATA